MYKNLWVIITTINKPTTAIKKFEELSIKFGFHLLIVGDVSTPEAYNKKNYHYLSINDQNEFLPKLSEKVPTKHYCRKNIGYAFAIANGAEWIFDTDDDNIPYDEFWEILNSANALTSISSSSRFCNIYKFFSNQNVWPRGLPLDEINANDYIENSIDPAKGKIQQFLADLEPDVDAIYRLVDNKQIKFDRSENGKLLEKGTWCPFNSQATLFHKSMFINLYLPCYVPFRMTDIWRSYVAQLGLWKKGYNLSFHAPIVEQYRNEHDFFEDFLDEIQGYENNKSICKALDNLLLDDINDSNILSKSYLTLKEFGIIDNREFDIIEEWNSFILGHIS